MTDEPKGPVAAEIEKRLIEALGPTHLRVINDSAKHSGHASSPGTGESHFTVEIVALQFEDMSRVERQRAVYDAVGGLMEEKVHALAINARAPDEIAE
ncbi:MAG: BolA family transcriptional regulator [Sphingomonadales bacterium]|nr:BolA family transcriptional regulator [Sphingomonadales bacterium]